MVKYKQVKENIVVDTLSRRHLVFSTLNTTLLGFEHMRDLYIKDVDFFQVYVVCEHSTFDKFYRFDEYLFKEKILCVPNYSMRELVVPKVHKGELI